MGTRRTVNVEKLLQFLSSRWLKGGQVAGEFIWVEDVPHLGLKTRKLSSELRVLICRLSEIQQFFTEKITQRALHAEPLFDPAGCPTLLQPDLVELHAGNYIAGDPKTQSTPGKTARQPEVPRSSAPRLTLTINQHCGPAGRLWPSAKLTMRIRTLGRAEPLAEELLEIVMRPPGTRQHPVHFQPPCRGLGELLGDSAAVTAMLDRLLHHGHILKCRPRSWRTKTDLSDQETRRNWVNYKRTTFRATSVGRF